MTGSSKLVSAGAGIGGGHDSYGYCPVTPPVPLTLGASPRPGPSGRCPNAGIFAVVKAAWLSAQASVVTVVRHWDRGGPVWLVRLRDGARVEDVICRDSGEARAILERHPNGPDFYPTLD
jgi:hypothetical protein